MKEVYFDNAATTRVRPEVVELMNKVMLEDYGNPSSRHVMGMHAERYLTTAAEQIAACLKVKPQEIVFNSGGTEGNNTALIGTALARKAYGKHIISTNIEHSAVYKPLEFLESLGAEVTFVPVDHTGHVNPEKICAAMRPDTILVSVMAVNNEIGSIQPLEEIGRAVKETNPSCWFHTDAIQAYGKLRLRPHACGVDLLSVASHKFHGPKGCGFLYVNEKLNLTPILSGGGQQRDMRPGTENVPGIAGTGLAAKLYYEHHEEHTALLRSVKERLGKRLSELPGVTLNSGFGEDFAPHILSASFEGIRAEVLLHALEEKGIYVSSGSACSSNHPGISSTLKAIGVPKELLDSTLRFSFGLFNTPDEADLCADALSELLPALRRFKRY